MSKINFVKILTGYGLKAAAGLSSGQALVVNFILNVLWVRVQKEYKKLKTYLTTKSENEKGLKEYDQQINKPEATPDDIKKSGKSFLES